MAESTREGYVCCVSLTLAANTHATTSTEAVRRTFPIFLVFLLRAAHVACGCFPTLFWRIHGRTDDCHLAAFWRQDIAVLVSERKASFARFQSGFLLRFASYLRCKPESGQQFFK